MNLRIITDPSLVVEPVSLAEAKANLNLAINDDDADISAAITAARTLAETVNGRVLCAQQFELALDNFPGTLPAGMTSISSPYFGFWPSDAYLLYNGARPIRSGIRLLAPLTSVQSVSYRDSSGNVTVLTENTDYVVDVMKEPGFVAPMWSKNWPTVDLWPSSAVRLKFTGGYGTYSGTVNVSGTAVTLTSGFQFSPLFDGRVITIGSTAYTFTYLTATTGTISASATATGAAYTINYAPPMPLQRGILRMVSQWYEKRVPFDAIRFVAEVPFDVRALFQHDMLVSFG